MKDKKMKYLVIFLVLFAALIIPLTYSKYVKKYTKQLSISARQPTYTVVFDANGGSGTMAPQTFTYKTPQQLDPNEFTNGTLVFDTWNTLPDGSGTSYEDEEEVDKLTTVDDGEVTLYAQWVDKAAKIGNKYYDTLGLAFDDVYSSSPQTTIVLLKDVNEVIDVPSGVDIILDLNNKTLGNDGNDNIIKNNGTLYIKNGNIYSDAPGNGAINNNRTGTLVLDGVHITAIAGKQALYNDKGNATIKGGSVLEATGNIRASVQNVSGGTLRVLDATIISTGFSGLVNAGTLYLGDNDDTIQDVPVIRGITYGIDTTTNVNYYDGVIKGIPAAINDDQKLRNVPTGHIPVDDQEDIDGVIYNIKYIGVGAKVTFDPNGGSTNESIRSIIVGQAIGPLPTAVKSGHTFDGWFTAKNGGTQIDEYVVINNDVTYYAHYTKNHNTVDMNGVLYDTLQEAIVDAPNNTPTTITLLQDVFETISIPSTKDIILDLDSHTLTNAGNAAVITNEGNLTIVRGTVRSDTDTATINHNAGTLNVTGGNVIATGTRGAIYITNGTVNISGTAYVSSQAYGSPTNSALERGAIQCLTGCTLNVTGGTIVGVKQQAISNEGIVNVGTLDGTVDSTTPIIQGKTYGVKSVGTFNFYDGILKGQTGTYNGTLSDTEPSSHISNGTEVIDGATYNTAIVELD